MTISAAITQYQLGAVTNLLQETIMARKKTTRLRVLAKDVPPDVFDAVLKALQEHATGVCYAAGPEGVKGPTTIYQQWGNPE